MHMRTCTQSDCAGQRSPAQRPTSDCWPSFRLSRLYNIMASNRGVHWPLKAYHALLHLLIVRPTARKLARNAIEPCRAITADTGK